MNSPSELPESTFPEYQFPPDFQPHKAEVVEPEYAHESDKFKLSGPDASGIPIVTEFLQSFPKKDLWVMGSRRQESKRKTGAGSFTASVRAENTKRRTAAQ